jgi:hypothetical protein
MLAMTRSYRCSGLLLESYAACLSAKPLSSQYSPKRHNTVSECIAKYASALSTEAVNTANSLWQQSSNVPHVLGSVELACFSVCGSIGTLLTFTSPVCSLMRFSPRQSTPCGSARSSTGIFVICTSLNGLVMIWIKEVSLDRVSCYPVLPILPFPKRSGAVPRACAPTG